MANPGKDLPLNASGTGIDFGRGTVSGIEELRNAALGRITNAITYDDAAYGLDLTGEIGTLAGPGYAQTLGLRCCVAIQNDSRFETSTVLNAKQTGVGATLAVSLSFEITVGDNDTFSLSVLVENGTVKLVS